MKSFLLPAVCAVSILLLGVIGPASAGDAVAPVVVIIEGSAFVPDTVTIKAGTEVVWRNKDSVPHTITADDGSFDSGSLNQGDEFKRKFIAPGTYKYSCDIHAYMSGNVIVKE